MGLKIQKQNLSDKIKDYKIYLLEAELSKNTIDKYLFDINQYLSQAADEISHISIMEYKEYLIKKYKPATVNCKIIALNKFLVWCGYNELRVKVVKIQGISSNDNVLSKADYYKLLEVAKNKGNWKMYYIMRVLAMTGIRVGELRDFTVEAINAGAIDIFNKGKIRRIYIGANVSALLEEYCKIYGIETGIIFTGNNLNAISAKTIWYGIKALAKDSGVLREKAYPHSFRHLFAKEYMRVSGDISELADMLGHSKIDTTWRYTRTSVDDKRTNLDKLDL